MEIVGNPISIVLVLSLFLCFAGVVSFFFFFFFSFFLFFFFSFFFFVFFFFFSSHEMTPFALSPLLFSYESFYPPSQSTLSLSISWPSIRVYTSTLTTLQTPKLPPPPSLRADEYITPSFFPQPPIPHLSCLPGISGPLP